MPRYLALAPVMLLIGAAPADKFDAADYLSDAKSLAELIHDNYAYLVVLNPC